ncbi:MAG: KH domain-containing protein [Candidatus Eremiobacteraeota bacterium]|nr:KH domain-containing protein [Candidatus Eremiobacteraeota bacterium]
MSAFDDEFGLFGDDEPKEEEERRPTLGARRLASGETIIDDIELEEGGPPRRRAGGAAERGGERRERGRRVRRERDPIDPAVAGRRAAELLYFLAQKLVSRPEAIAVQTVPGDRGPVLELEVDHEDIGKVIGRSGRVAQALRTLVRAGAEGKVGVEIIEVEDEDAEASGDAAGDVERDEADEQAEVTDA